MFFGSGRLHTGSSLCFWGQVGHIAAVVSVFSASYIMSRQ